MSRRCEECRLMNPDFNFDESRVFRGPRGVSVYVPPKPAPQPDDDKRDFPPSHPPEVYYDGAMENYWKVLQEGRMPYLHGTKVFTEEVMAWLHTIESDVEKLVLKG